MIDAPGRGRSPCLPWSPQPRNSSPGSPTFCSAVGWTVTRQPPPDDADSCSPSETAGDIGPVRVLGAARISLGFPDDPVLARLLQDERHQ
jgi:hypothetical protein